jgi:hypothetical protein
MITIEKELSENDTGETGGHQAGMLVPKSMLDFFPTLPSGVKNPRRVLDLIDQAGRVWSFNFIYYNNRFFGGTRNEYRLTGMTEFVRAFNLKAGDRIVLERISDRLSRIRYRRKHEPIERGILKLAGAGWRVIDYSSDE